METFSPVHDFHGLRRNHERDVRRDHQHFHLQYLASQPAACSKPPHAQSAQGWIEAVPLWAASIYASFFYIMRAALKSYYHPLCSSYQSSNKFWR